MKSFLLNLCSSSKNIKQLWAKFVFTSDTQALKSKIKKAEYSHQVEKKGLFGDVIKNFSLRNAFNREIHTEHTI